MIRVNALSESRGSGIPPRMVMPALRVCRTLIVIDRSHAPLGNAALDAPASTHQRLRNGIIKSGANQIVGWCGRRSVGPRRMSAAIPITTGRQPTQGSRLSMVSGGQWVIRRLRIALTTSNRHQAVAPFPPFHACSNIRNLPTLPA